MNNLMTSSFLSYFDLKKQAEMEAGITPEPDIESQLSNAEQQNLSLFHSQVEPIQSEITSISALLTDLTRLHSESKTTTTRNLLRGIHDQIESNVTSILQKAQNIKSSLAALDASNVDNRLKFGENSPVDRTRTVVTNGLRSKLRELMNGFGLLRQSIAMEESGGGKEDGVGYKGVNELKRSLSRLHQVFLDMAIVVERQGEEIDDIEENVVKAREYVSGGTGRLAEAVRLKGKRKVWWVRFWGCVLVVLVLVLVVLIFHFAD